MQTPTYLNTLDLNKLLEDLDDKFPDVMPDLNLSEKEFGYRVGQISVVRHLKHTLLDED